MYDKRLHDEDSLRSREHLRLFRCRVRCELVDREIKTPSISLSLSALLLAGESERGMCTTRRADFVPPTNKFSFSSIQKPTSGFKTPSISFSLSALLLAGERGMCTTRRADFVRPTNKFSLSSIRQPTRWLYTCLVSVHDTLLLRVGRWYGTAHWYEIATTAAIVVKL